MSCAEIVGLRFDVPVLFWLLTARRRKFCLIFGVATFIMEFILLGETFVFSRRRVFFIFIKRPALASERERAFYLYSSIDFKEARQ